MVNDKGMLLTYPLSQFHIKIHNNKLVCYSYFNKMFYISQQPRWIAPVVCQDIFKCIYELGRVIDNELKDIKYTGYNEDSDNLFNITNEQIINSSTIVLELERFFKEYGFSTSEKGQRMKPDCSIDINDPTYGIFDSEPNPFSLESLPIFFYLLPHKMQDAILKTGCIKTKENLLPFINLSLMIYYIKRFNNGFKKNEVSTIVNLSKVFTELRDRFKITDEITYNSEKKKNSLSFYNKIIKTTEIYVNKYFSNNNFTWLTMPHINTDHHNEESYIADVYDSYGIENAFYSNEYIITNPIVAAWYFTLQSIKAKGKNMGLCEECHSIVTNKTKLCRTCKLIFCDQVISEYKIKNNNKWKILEKERELLTDGYNESHYNISETPLIDEIYNNRNKQKKYDNKIKKV